MGILSGWLSLYPRDPGFDEPFGPFPILTPDEELHGFVITVVGVSLLEPGIQP